MVRFFAQSSRYMPVLAVVLLVITLVGTQSASAQTVAEGPGGAQISADEVTQDRDLGLVTARGSVEVVYGTQVLRADTMTYNINADIISASSNVTLLQSDGSVIFSEYFEISGDLKKGIAKNIRILLADKQSRLTALSATRQDGNTTVLRDATYTNCKPCNDKHKGSVLWQIKALNVIHDQKARRIEYEDAWLEFMGIPIAYTPYLTHPDPTVKRESGLLTPTWTASNALGGAVTTPYFFNLGPNKDATFSPIFTTAERVVLVGEYRSNLQKGDMQLNSSVTFDSQDKFRGHFFGKGTYEHDQNWRSKLAVRRSTDDTYLRRYGFNNEAYLTTEGITEGFIGRSYASAKFMSFQGMTADHDPGNTPLILPLLNYNYVGMPSRSGGFTTFDANGLAIARDQGVETRRVSSELGWNRPFTSKFGEVYKFRTSLRGDAYHVTDQTVGSQSFTGFTGRILPQASLDWRLPMVSQSGSKQQVLEPIIVGVVSPYGNNPAKIPNEDSRDFEFDDTNLFSNNRFTGLDRVEGGPRVNYGLGWSMHSPTVGQTEVLVGQSYRVHKDSTFAAESGLEKNFSDVVGRIKYNPTDQIGLGYRFRLSNQDFAARRSELNFKLGPKSLNLGANYIYVNQNPSVDETAEFGDREEVSMTLSSQMTRYWSASLSTRHDLTENGGPLSSSLNAIYDNECFSMTSSIAKSYTSDRDINNGVSVMFRVVFKTLGEVQAGL